MSIISVGNNNDDDKNNIHCQTYFLICIHQIVIFCVYLYVFGKLVIN